MILVQSESPFLFQFPPQRHSGRDWLCTPLLIRCMSSSLDDWGVVLVRSITVRNILVFATLATLFAMVFQFRLSSWSPLLTPSYGFRCQAPLFIAFSFTAQCLFVYGILWKQKYIRFAFALQVTLCMVFIVFFSHLTFQLISTVFSSSIPVHCHDFPTHSINKIVIVIFITSASWVLSKCSQKQCCFLYFPYLCIIAFAQKICMRNIVILFVITSGHLK